MKAPILAEHSNSKAAWAAAVNGISPSLMPLIFHHLDEKGLPALSAFKVTTLPRTAAIICKLAGLLIQANWYLLKSQNSKECIPPELNDLLLQIWAGHQRYNELLSTSVLQYAGIAPDSSSLSKLVKNPEILYRWGDLLRSCEGRLKVRMNEFSKGDWYDNFTRLIEALPILQVVEFDAEHFTFPDGRVPPFPYVYNSPRCRDTMYLYKFEQTQSKPTIIFEDPHGDYTEELTLENEPELAAQYSLIRQVLGFKDVRQGIIHLFDAYKYIQNLSRAIAKTPGESLDALIESHRGKFSGISPEDSDESKADFLTLILADQGPTSVLKTLLSFNRDLLKHYLHRLEELGIVASAADWQQTFEERKKQKQDSVRGFLELAPAFKKKVHERIDLETRCWCVIKAAGLELDSPHDYVESIGMRIKMLETLSEQFRSHTADLWSVGIRTAKLVERTLRFLICFYSGLNSYYISCQKDRHNFIRHEEMMVTEARKTYRNVLELSPGLLIKMFRELCEQMNREVTFKLLGRSRICRIDKFNKLTGGKWTDIAEVINRVKHDKPKGEVSRDEFLAFLSQSIKLFKFFRDGRDLDDALPFRERLCESIPIYPSVVSFREQHRKRDGLVICNYKVYSHDWKEPDDNEDLGIKIFSPHEYAPNEEYYCVPFHKKTTKEWLLDPFLISCDKVNKMIKDLPDEQF